MFSKTQSLRKNMRKSDCGFWGFRVAMPHPRKFFVSCYHAWWIWRENSKNSNSFISSLPTHTQNIFNVTLVRGCCRKNEAKGFAFFHCFLARELNPRKFTSFFEEYLLHLNLTTNNESIMGVFKRVFGARFMS